MNNAFNLTYPHYRKSLSWLVFGYLLILLALVFLPFWPEFTWPIAAFFNFSPHWLFVIPALILAPFCLIVRRYELVAVLLVALCLCLKFSGWVFNIAPTETSSNASDLSLSSEPLVVLTANMGYANYDLLNKLIVENNVDLIALQESSAELIAPLLATSPLNSVCSDGLCLLSHLNLKLIGAKDRTFLQGLGVFAMQVEVSLPPSDTPLLFKTFDFFVLHLDTPRKGFEAILAHPVSGWGALKEAMDRVITESWIASSWVAQGRNPIAAGDFNLPRNNPIFAKYWHWMSDSFQESGNGFGYSKHTHWHGVQIDHILHSEGWRTQKTWIGSALAGDHAPVLSVLNQQ